MKKWYPHRKLSSIFIIFSFSLAFIYLWPKRLSIPNAADNQNLSIGKEKISEHLIILPRFLSYKIFISWSESENKCEK